MSWENMGPVILPTYDLLNVGDSVSADEIYVHIYLKILSSDWIICYHGATQGNESEQHASWQSGGLTAASIH